MLLSSLLGEPLARKAGQWPVSQAPGVLFPGAQSAAGVAVDEEKALSLSGVFAACNLLSSVEAALPLKVYRQSGRDRQPATTHPGYRVLASTPNPEMTAFTFRKLRAFYRLLWGQSPAEVQWAGSGSVAAVWPVEPWRVRPGREEDGSLFYLVDGRRKVAPDDMLYTMLVSYDGVCGRSFVDYACESLGLGMAAQEFAARYFGNGARPGAVLTNPGHLTKEQRDEFKRSWQEKHGGPQNASRTAVLWGGWTYATDGAVDPEKQQLLEQRRFSIEEVARWLNVPPHLLRDLSRSTNNNIEHQGIDFVVYSLGPALVGEEQEYDRKLLSPPDLYCKHNVTALLRGDSAARNTYYSGQFNIGSLSINEIRELEERNPVPGGDTYFVPLNMVPLEQAVRGDQGGGEGRDDQPVPEEKQPSGASPGPLVHRGGAADGMRTLLAHTLHRMAKVEGNAIRRAADRPSQFISTIEAFYVKHRTTLSEAVSPVLSACVAIGVRPMLSAEEIANLWCKQSQAAMIEAAGRAVPATLLAEVASAMAIIEGQKPKQLAEVAIPGPSYLVDPVPEGKIAPPQVEDVQV